MANFGEMKIELTEESIAAMKEFSAALNHFSDEMSKTVVAFQEFQSAQQSVEPTCATCGDSGRGLPTLSDPDGAENACRDCGSIV